MTKSQDTFLFGLEPESPLYQSGVLPIELHAQLHISQFAASVLYGRE